MRRDFSHLEGLGERFGGSSPPRSGLPLSAVPVVTTARAELGRHAIDHRAGFLLSLIDGQTTDECLIDLSAMPRAETLSLLQHLIKQGIVSLA